MNEITNENGTLIMNVMKITKINLDFGRFIVDLLEIEYRLLLVIDQISHFV
jgi:hypothetical protein